MVNKVPLALQTLYAELIDQSAADAFIEAFPQPGEFTSKTVKGRRYWYFQATDEGRRTQKYVGPDDPILQQRIENHKTMRAKWKERREIVQVLKKARMPAPDDATGEVLKALSDAGVFRLRAVLVGTMAYQLYAPLLGVRWPSQSLRTGDIDIAQFQSVSVAVEDQTPAMLNILKQADPSFEPLITTLDHSKVTVYSSKRGVRVEFLTPNEGPDDDEPKKLPALQTDAVSLRFLDYLIYKPVDAVVLYDAGVLVQIPPPERYALHKLIVARRRWEGAVKVDKDLAQAATLIEVMLEKRKPHLRDAAREILQRGPEWRRYFSEGLEMIESKIADEVRRIAKDRPPKISIS